MQEARQEPAKLIATFGVTQVINTFFYVLLVVVPFYSNGLAGSSGGAVLNYQPYSVGALGRLFLGAAGFLVSIGQLLELALLAALVVLLPYCWARLSRAERLLWPAATVAGLLAYALTWTQFYAMQKWILG